MTAINVTSHSRAWLGVVVALAAAAGYAVANTSASLAYQGGSNPLTVAATRFLVPTVALIIWLRLSGLSLMLPKRDTLIAVLLGFITALYTWALLRSFNALPFALAVLIFYLFPLIAAVIVAAFGWHSLPGEPVPRSSLRWLVWRWRSTCAAATSMPAALLWHCSPRWDWRSSSSFPAV
jgi:drug/metabolite transporter (DMT)-like permease